MTDTALVVCVALPLAAGILTAGLSRSPLLQTTTAWLAVLIQLAAACALVAGVDTAGYATVQMGDWAAPFGIALVADRFAAIMVAVSAVIGLAVVAYALATRDPSLSIPRFLPLSFFLLAGVNGSFLTGDLFNLYVWFEVMLISSFVLMTLGGTRSQLDGGLKYVLMNLFASMLFLIGVGILYGKLGTLNMADISAKLAVSEDSLTLNTTSVLLLAAFGIKAGIFPFFFWLPASYHTPPVVVSGLFAALLTKVGVYAMMRSHLLLFSKNFDSFQLLLAVLAAATMVTGVLGAASHFNIRRILSFHIISQIGYMIMGLAIATPLAVTGTIFYLVHHIIVKTNLFLIGGIIRQRNGTEDLARLGGLVKSTPWLAGLFLIPALSLAGIPPLSGFWAKLVVVRASLEGGFLWLAVVALAVGALTLYSMTKIWNEAFWKKDPNDEGKSGTAPNCETPRGLPGIGTVAALAALTVAIGITVAPLLNYSQRAADQLLAPESYIQAVLGKETP